MSDSFNINTSNEIIDAGPAFISPPDIRDKDSYLSQEELIARLDTIDSPRERLFNLLKNVFTMKDPTHESNWITSCFISAGAGGFAYGSLIKSRDLHTDYIRRHNASVFEGKFRANRHFWDTLIVGASGRGTKYGIRCSLLVGTASIIAIGSCTYRNKLYLPDYLVGFTTLGAITRLWLGPRAILVGGLFGTIAGVISWGLVRLVELNTGMSVTEMRRLNHQVYLDQQEDRHRRYLEDHEYKRSLVEQHFQHPDSFR